LDFFRRFLNFYQRSETLDPYLTNAIASAISYAGGDFVAQLITLAKNPFDPWKLVFIAALSFYYAWETPLTLRKINDEIPIQDIDVTPQLRAIMNGARKVFHGTDVISNLKFIGGD
jgi:hypothetical protein